MYGISIEHKNKTITITKKFEKLTKNFASDESKELGRAMRQYPTYKLKIREIEKNPDKMTYKGLTYDIMKDYFTANKADRAKYLRDKLDEMRGRKNGKRDVTMIVCSYGRCFQSIGISYDSRKGAFGNGKRQSQGRKDRQTASGGR